MTKLEKMTTEELRAELERQTREALIEQIEGVQRRISEMLKGVASAVLSDALGLSIDRFDGRVRIDTHSIRTNAAAQAAYGALAEHARAELTKIVGEATITLTKKQIADARRAYAEALGETLEQQLREKAEDRAREETDRLLGEALR